MDPDLFQIGTAAITALRAAMCKWSEKSCVHCRIKLYLCALIWERLTNLRTEEII